MVICYSQSKYIQDLLTRLNVNNVNGVPTSMLSNCKLSRHGSNSFSDSHVYSYLLYVTLTKSNIAFNVNKTCRFMSSPLGSHQFVVKRILRYLSGTLTYDRLLSPSSSTHKFSLRTYSNSDQVSDPDNHKSTSLSSVYFGSNLVSEF